MYSDTGKEGRIWTTDTGSIVILSSGAVENVDGGEIQGGAYVGAWAQTKAVMDANKESLVEGFYTGSLEDSKRGSYVWVNVGGGLGKRGELNNTDGLIESVRDVKLWLGGFDNAGSVLSQEFKTSVNASGAVVNQVVGRGAIGVS